MKTYFFVADIKGLIPVTVTAATLSEAKEKAQKELDRATYGTAKLGKLVSVQ